MKKRAVRDLDKTRKVILKKAFQEVFRHGFQGASVDDIVAKTHLTKGALYHQFPTKLDLGYALVEEMIGPMMIDRWVKPLAAFDNPVDGILHQMKVLIGGRPWSETKWGCPLNNLVQEMAPLDPGFRKRLQAALTLWINSLAQCLQRGKDTGYLKATVNAQQAATFIVMAHEGFFGLMKGLHDPAAFDFLFRPLQVYLHSLCVKSQR